MSSLSTLLLCLSASLALGCDPAVWNARARTATSAATSPSEERDYQPGQCATTKEVVDERGRTTTAPFSASDYLSYAAVYRDRVLTAHNTMEVPAPPAKSTPRPPPVEWPVELTTALDCYTRARKLAPDNYEATLGLGVTYLIAAHFELRNAEVRQSYGTHARKYLGQAFVQSGGSYEPLYYLADQAILDGDFTRAAHFLSALQEAGIKPDATAMCYGFIAERQNRRDISTRWYARALQLGASKDTLGFLAQRLQKGSPR